MFLAEFEFPPIADRFHGESYGVDDHTGNIPPRPKLWLRELDDIGRVEDGDGQGARLHPFHLEDPEAAKFEKVLALVVESIIFSGFEDAVEEESTEAQAPERHEEGDDGVARIMCAGEGEGDDGESDEVCAASEVWGSVGRRMRMGKEDQKEDCWVGERAWKPVSL